MGVDMAEILSLLQLNLLQREVKQIYDFLKRLKRVGFIYFSCCELNTLMQREKKAQTFWMV